MENGIIYGHRHGEIPQAELERLEHALRETSDQWDMALSFADGHVGDVEPYLGDAIRHEIALALMGRLAMNLRRQLRLFTDWDVLDWDHVAVTAHEGLVYANGVALDDGEPAVLLAPVSSLDPDSDERWTVVRWSRVWRAEIDWSPHAYEGTATVMIIEDSEDCD